MEVFTGLPGTGLHLVFLVQELSCLTAPAPPLSASRFYSEEMCAIVHQIHRQYQVLTLSRALWEPLQEKQEVSQRPRSVGIRNMTENNVTKLKECQTL